MHEALLLRLALSSLTKLSETPFKQERESLLAKVQALLPRQEGDDLEQLQQALSFTVPARSYPTPFLDSLLQSAQEQQWLAVTYRSENGVSQQNILPMHIYAEAGLWYCHAYSYEREAVRVYRVDRFLEVSVAPSPPRLAHSVSPIVHVHPSFPEVRISLTARGVLRLEREPYLAARVQPQGDGEGLLSVHLRPEEYDWLVRILLSFGIEAKVLVPEGLRLRIQQIAQEIARHYAEL